MTYCAFNPIYFCNSLTFQWRERIDNYPQLKSTYTAIGWSCSDVVATLSQHRKLTLPQLSFSTLPQRCDNVVTASLCQLGQVVIFSKHNSLCLKEPTNRTCSYFIDLKLQDGHARVPAWFINTCSSIVYYKKLIELLTCPQ